MIKLNVYLTFSGNCREAMTFYKECFGGELELQTIGDSPLSSDLPKKMKECILQATLRNENLIIMGTDMAPKQLTIGNSVSMMLFFKSKKELKKVYQLLVRDGNAIHPPEPTYYGNLLGNVSDKFGNQWLLHC